MQLEILKEKNMVVLYMAIGVTGIFLAGLVAAHFKGQSLSKEERLTVLVERYLEVSRENRVLKAKVKELSRTSRSCSDTL